jgi:hypothetical protein
MKRTKNISNSLRFEVFKRDGFKCQYCGQSPPSVKLEVDHILAVSNGGETIINNLITACFECNRGKAARPLGVVPDSLQDSIEERKERTAQVEAYNEFLMELRDRETEILDEIGSYWFNKFEKKRNHYVFGITRIPTIKTFLRRLAPAEILNSIDTAFGKFPMTIRENDYKTFKYFCGVCWTKIRRADAKDKTD